MSRFESIYKWNRFKYKYILLTCDTTASRVWTWQESLTTLVTSLLWSLSVVCLLSTLVTVMEPCPMVAAEPSTDPDGKPKLDLRVPQDPVDAQFAEASHRDQQYFQPWSSLPRFPHLHWQLLCNSCLVVLVSAVFFWLEKSGSQTHFLCGVLGHSAPWN